MILFHTTNMLFLYLPDELSYTIIFKIKRKAAASTFFCVCVFLMHVRTRHKSAFYITTNGSCVFTFKNKRNQCRFHMNFNNV